MTVAVLIPADPIDDWRSRALDYVERWYATHLPEASVHIGACPPDAEWSKGAAIADALERAGDPAVLVIADADSFTQRPEDLRAAVDLVERAGRPWTIPHGKVYRLKAKETERLYADPTNTARLGHTVRSPYEGPPGGGITVVARAVYEAAGGIDPRFLGWGGEDVAFGWALETLTGPGYRIGGPLVHLWHPHPAPNLRGSPASEELVARYRSARGVPRRMAAVVADGDWTPAEPLADPVQFTITGNRTSLRLPSGDIVRFRHNRYTTTDPDEIEQLRSFRIVREENR